MLPMQSFKMALKSRKRSDFTKGAEAEVGFYLSALESDIQIHIQYL